MKENLVTTVNGEIIESSKCRYIDKEYYKLGDINIENSGDCYFLDGRYVRYNTGHIEYDHEKKQYIRKNNVDLMYGIVGIKEGEFILGYFSTNPINNVIVYLEDGNGIRCINEKIVQDNLYYREELSTGDYYHISLKKANIFKKLAVVDRRVKEALPYDSREILDAYIAKFKKNYKPEISEAIEKYGSVIGNLSFGLEFETVKGIIPQNKLEVLPLIPLRDGSIQGLEYVTIPLEGNNGLQAVVDILKELNKRTEYDNSCALHLHIGNIPRTKEFILAFYKLASHLQDEIFSMFPLYKKYNFGVKRKNYSKPFPQNQLNAQMDPVITDKNIDINFDVLYKYLSVGQSFYDVNCDLKNVKSHPSDPNGTAKWNISTRYYAINFIPLLFGNKKTIEFRIHTPTYDISKIICFVIMNAIIINWCLVMQKQILNERGFLFNWNLTNILRDYISRNLKDDSKHLLMDHLNDYIAGRVETTFRQNCNGNIVGNEEEIVCNNYIDWSLKKGEGNNEEQIELNKALEEFRRLSHFGTPNAIVFNNKRDLDTILYDNSQLRTQIPGMSITLSDARVFTFSGRHLIWQFIGIGRKPVIPRKKAPKNNIRVVPVDEAQEAPVQFRDFGNPIQEQQVLVGGVELDAFGNVRQREGGIQEELRQAAQRRVERHIDRMGREAGGFPPPVDEAGNFPLHGNQNMIIGDVNGNIRFPDIRFPEIPIPEEEARRLEDEEQNDNEW